MMCIVFTLTPSPSPIQGEGNVEQAAPVFVLEAA